jgi:GDPmannose 4,6-dehydratase
MIFLIDILTPPFRILVKVDPSYFRPTEVEQLLGDPTKAKTVLGWVRTVDFPNLVRDMITHDMAKVDAGDLHN